MSGFIQGEDRSQATLFPERLDDYVAEDSAVRVIDVFIDELDLSGMGFKTIADFRKDNGTPIRLVCRQFVILCRNLNLFANAGLVTSLQRFGRVARSHAAWSARLAR